MIIDKDNVFLGSGTPNTQTIAIAGAAVTSVPLDLGEAGDAIGQELTLHVIPTSTFVGGTSVQFKLQTASANVDSSYRDVVLSPAVVTSNLVAGKEAFCVRVPQGLDRFVRLHCGPSGTFTSGGIMAFMDKDL